MILYKNRSFMTRSDVPNEDFQGDADYIIPDESELAKKVISLYPNFKIVTDEENKIIDILQDNSVSLTVEKDNKISSLSSICSSTITAGTDVEWMGETKHYSLTLEDQSNLMALYTNASFGLSVPYHADSETCRIYSAEEFQFVFNTVSHFKVYHTTYFNMLKHMILEMETKEEIEAAEYGMPLNDKYQKLLEEVIS